MVRGEGAVGGAARRTSQETYALLSAYLEGRSTMSWLKYFSWDYLKDQIRDNFWKYLAISYGATIMALIAGVIDFISDAPAWTYFPTIGVIVASGLIVFNQAPKAYELLLSKFPITRRGKANEIVKLIAYGDQLGFSRGSMDETTLVNNWKPTFEFWYQDCQDKIEGLFDWAAMMQFVDERLPHDAKFATDEERDIWFLKSKLGWLRRRLERLLSEPKG